jgi:hypothetical protein
MQDLSPLDSDLSQLGWRRGSHRASGKAIRADPTGGSDRAKPQVTRVIGVLDPYRLPDFSTLLALSSVRKDQLAAGEARRSNARRATKCDVAETGDGEVRGITA